VGYYLGIDGGGTRTTAWVSDARGNVLARCEAGPCNPLKVGFEAAQRELLRAARAALSQARSAAALRESAPPRARGKRGAVPGGRYRGLDLDAVCAGVAGVDRRQAHRRFFAWLRGAIPARHHLLTVDAAIALRAAVGTAPGIIVISGTGSIAYGQDERGNIRRAGGWGIPFDDLGSGYDLGRRAVVSALQDFDGRGQPTCLTRHLCLALGLKKIIEVVPLHLSQHQIAALFPLVLEAARKKDKVARSLCYQAGIDLANLARAAIQRFGWQRRAPMVVCAGGVLRSSPLIRRAFSRHVRALAPRAAIRLLRREPVEGALDFARDLANPHELR
jgi:N-acetylglucosamine kinase-like BadF-type ATPase